MASLAQAAVTGSGSGGNTTLTLGGTSTTGNVLVLVVGSTSGSDASAPASGQGGVTTWTQEISTVRRSSQLFYGVVDGTPSASVLFNNQFRTAAYALMEIQGLNTGSLIHGTPIKADGAAGGGGGTASSGAFTPTASAAVFLVGCGALQGGATSNAGGSWTDALGSGSISPVAYQDVASASGSYTASWGIGAFGTWDAQLVAFNSSGGAAPLAPSARNISQAVNRASTY